MSHLLDELSGPARQALSILAAKLPPAPTRVLVEIDERATDTPQPPDTLLVYVPLFANAAERAPDNLNATEPAPDNLLARMLDGAGVRACPNPVYRDQSRLNSGGPPPDPDVRYLAARSAAAAWLLDRDPQRAAGPDEEPEAALVRQALEALRAQPAGEQRARVTALRDAERTCAEGDRLELLTGTGGAR
jgi:hypothetical protein